MILNNTPQNEAILSNVAEIGEFRIRNSSKAFSILSSGLYSNKIKAIIRELSCNAVDSHIAAGKPNEAFEVHLPNSFEPWFSVRDFGTGLSHDQVTNIYTTYFESTKTDSNDFIGALGLGSKSPFSYTDNFTVTAVKDGRKGIYSAFISDAGVPSIALMFEEESSDVPGVEVKFAVTDDNDFYKFNDEACEIYKWFTLKPIVTGVNDFTIGEIQYETENLIPGVHVRAHQRYGAKSYAVMGNIAYPIDVPNYQTVLGNLHELLDCHLVLHFDIGELDFQASREGLSYIPSTIQSIKRKLEQIRDQLGVHIEAEVKAIDNEWKKAEYLVAKLGTKLWKAPTAQYVEKNDIKCVDLEKFSNKKRFDFTVEELGKKYNISVLAFSKTRSSSTCSNLKAEWIRDPSNSANMIHTWDFTVDPATRFVINDTNIGALERAKHHWRSMTITEYSHDVHVLSRLDKNKEMNTKAFFKALLNPPEDQIIKASDMATKERQVASIGSNVTILTLERRKDGYRYNERIVWADAGKLKDFSDTENLYYVPLSGYKVISKANVEDAKDIYAWLKDCGINDLKSIKIYGVRKADLEAVKAKANWKNLEDHIKGVLSQQGQQLVEIAAARKISVNKSFVEDKAINLIANDSPYVKLANAIKKVDSVKFDNLALEHLHKTYNKGSNFVNEVELKRVELNEIVGRYPMLKYTHWTPHEDIAEYINLVDKMKGI